MQVGAEIGKSQIKIMDGDPGASGLHTIEAMSSTELLCDECQKKINEYREEQRDRPSSLPKAGSMAFEFGKGIEMGHSGSVLDQSFIREDYMRAESFATDADLAAEQQSLNARKFSEIMTQADGLARKSSKSMVG